MSFGQPTEKVRDYDMAVLQSFGFCMRRVRGMMRATRFRLLNCQVEWAEK